MFISSEYQKHLKEVHGVPIQCSVTPGESMTTMVAPDSPLTLDPSSTSGVLTQTEHSNIGARTRSKAAQLDTAFQRKFIASVTREGQDVPSKRVQMKSLSRLRPSTKKPATRQQALRTESPRQPRSPPQRSAPVPQVRSPPVQQARSPPRHQAPIPHGYRKAYRCAWCKDCFTTKSSLNRHSLRHTGQKDHQCLICGRRFSLPQSLQRHTLTHTGERPYHCRQPGCRARFAQSGQLTRHERAKHDQNIKPQGRLAQSGEEPDAWVRMGNEVMGLKFGKSLAGNVSPRKEYSLEKIVDSETKDSVQDTDGGSKEAKKSQILSTIFKRPKKVKAVKKPKRPRGRPKSAKVPKYPKPSAFALSQMSKDQSGKDTTISRNRRGPKYKCKNCRAKFTQFTELKCHYHLCVSKDNLIVITPQEEEHEKMEVENVEVKQGDIVKHETDGGNMEGLEIDPLQEGLKIEPPHEVSVMETVKQGPKIEPHQEGLEFEPAQDLTSHVQHINKPESEGALPVIVEPKIEMSSQARNSGPLLKEHGNDTQLEGAFTETPSDSPEVGSPKSEPPTGSENENNEKMTKIIEPADTPVDSSLSEEAVSESPNIESSDKVEKTASPFLEQMSKDPKETIEPSDSQKEYEGKGSPKPETKHVECLEIEPSNEPSPDTQNSPVVGEGGEQKGVPENRPVEQKEGVEFQKGAQVGCNPETALEANSLEETDEVKGQGPEVMGTSIEVEGLQPSAKVNVEDSWPTENIEDQNSDINKGVEAQPFESTEDVKVGSCQVKGKSSEVKDEVKSQDSIDKNEDKHRLKCKSSVVNYDFC